MSLAVVFLFFYQQSHTCRLFAHIDLPAGLAVRQGRLSAHLDLPVYAGRAVRQGGLLDDVLTYL